MLRKNGFGAEQLIALAHDFTQAGLAAEEVAMMSFVQKMTLRAHEITEQDIETLRAHGFDDSDILDCVLAGASRCFYSKTLDALGAVPDDAYLDLEPELRQALAMGRPFPP